MESPPTGITIYIAFICKFSSGPPSAAIFNILNPYSGSDYHQRSVHKLAYSTWHYLNSDCFSERIYLSHCCIASTAKLHNWIRSLYFWQYSDAVSNISDFMIGETAESSLFFVLQVISNAYAVCKLKFCKKCWPPNPLHPLHWSRYF